MRRISILVAFMVAVGAWAGFATPASAQYANSLVCSFTAVEPGATVTVSGDGFDPGSQITVTITDEALPPYALGALAASSSSVSGAFSRDVLVTTADADGNLSATFVVPADTPPGDYSILADGVGQDLAARALTCPISVVSDVDLDPIAFTGSNTKPMVQIALAVMAVGALLVFATRRNRDEEQAVSSGV